jgi:hypothetical protein
MRGPDTGSLQADRRKAGLLQGLLRQAQAKKRQLLKPAQNFLSNHFFSFFSLSDVPALTNIIMPIIIIIQSLEPNLREEIARHIPEDATADAI